MHVETEQKSTHTSLFVDSIRRVDPDAEIIQCSDRLTPAIPNIDRLFSTECDKSFLMTARLEMFSALNLSKPAIYLDTDMLVLKPVPVGSMILDKIALICRREFNLSGVFRGRPGLGMEFMEYDKQPLGQVFPFVACATVTRNFLFWELCLKRLKLSARKYWRWYGDQLAIREVFSLLPRQSIGFLPESMFGCLPEHVSELSQMPFIVHFKGDKRKPMMAAASFEPKSNPPN